MQEQDSSTSIYSTLKLDSGNREIRLLTILPGAWKDTICCRLEVVSLNSLPKLSYGTVSYTWGSTKDAQEVMINGVAFAMGASAHGFLRRTRLQQQQDCESSLSVARFPIQQWWMDAVSIDQTNIDERTQQVAMMADIYTNCVRVHIWLGEAMNNPLPGLLARKEGVIIDNAQSSIDPNLEPPKDTMAAHWTGNQEKDAKLWAKFWSEFGTRDGVRGYRDLKNLDSVFHAFGLLGLMAADKHNHEMPAFTDPRKPYGRLVAFALQDIFQRPWWYRIWTAQESILPQEAVLMYGPVTAALKTVITDGIDNYARHCKECCSGFSIPAEYGRVMRVIGHSLNATMALLKLKSDPKALDVSLSTWMLCRLFRGRLSTDPRDKVYGLLGLVQDWFEETPFVPDYHTPVRKLFTDFTVTILTESDFLPLHGTHKRLIPNLPSWVIDWSYSLDMFVHDQEVDCRNKYNSTDGQSANLRFFLPSLMEVSAYEIDQVTVIGDVYTLPLSIDAKNFKQENQKALRQWFLLAGLDEEPDREYITGGLIWEAWWRTLCGDCTSDPAVYSPEGHMFRRCVSNDVRMFIEWCKTKIVSPFRDRPIDLTPKEQHLFRIQCSGFDQLDAQDTHEARAGSPDETQTSPEQLAGFFHMAVDATCGRRRFFLTEMGFMGIGPEELELGDSVFLLMGSEAPFALRSTGRFTQREDGTSKQPIVEDRPIYELLGDCYVHGIMDGEALSTMSDDDEEIIYIA